MAYAREFEIGSCEADVWQGRRRVRVPSHEPSGPAQVQGSWAQANRREIVSQLMPSREEGPRSSTVGGSDEARRGTGARVNQRVGHRLVQFVFGRCCMYVQRRHTTAQHKVRRQEGEVEM
jgi:hypothetical protein